MKSKFIKNSIGISSKKSLWKEMWKRKELYLLALPGLIYLIIFRYFPYYGLQIAFKDYNLLKGITGSEWVGLKHFQLLFNDDAFLNVIKNTIIISLYKLFIGFPAPIILAILLNELRLSLYKRTVQTITYIPYFISWVVISGIFIDILSPNSGVVNQIIQYLGGEPIFFLSSSTWFRSVLVGTDIFKNIGWNSIIYLAAITSIDPQLYEAAIVDGANRLQRIWHITLPGIRTTIVILLIIRIGYMLNAGLEQVLMLYNPNVYDVADIIDTFVYRYAFRQMRLSFSTAAGLFKSVVACTLLLITNTISRRISDSSLF